MDDWDQFAEVSTDDALASLTQQGIVVTSGFRTPEDVRRLKAEGYTPASSGGHMSGDGVDLVPGKSGMSLEQLAEEARQKFGPKAIVGIHNGSHVDVKVPGWGNAPDIYRKDPWDAFDVVDKAKPGKPQSVDYSEMVGDRIETVAAAPGSTTHRVEDTDASAKLDSLIRSGIPYGEALTQIHADFPEYPAFSPSTYAEAQKYHRDHPDYQGSFAAAMKSVPLSEEEKANNDFVQSPVGVFAGKMINAALAGAPVAAAGDAGNYWETVAETEHPNISLAADLAGNVAGAVLGGKAVGAGARAVAEGEGVLAPLAAQVVEHPGITQSAVDAGMGAGYGAAEAGPGHRLEGAGYGAATTLALEGAGRAAIKASGVGRNIAEEAAGAPLEGEVVREAPIASEAAMASDVGPSVASRPVDRIDVTPGTSEQRAIAAEVQPEQVTRPSLGDLAKAGNINLKNIDKPEDIDALMKFTTDSFDEFKLERRGEQSWAATEALAKDLGMTPDELLGRQTGEAFNAEQSLAARNLLHASADETRKLAVAAINGTVADKAAFVKSFLLHAAITEKASGAAAEAGRALNIYRKVAKASLGDRQSIQEAVKRLQDGVSVDDIAGLVNSLADDPSALNKFARDAIKPAFKDKLMFVWINSLLSGPKTHIVNVTSNLVTALMETPEMAIAAGIGVARKAAGGNSDRVLMSEVGPRLFGTLRGASDALAAAKKGWSEEAGGKIDAVRPAIGGTAGKIIGVPTRLLNVEDEMFKAMARRSEMAGMAVRKARMEGLKGGELKARIDDLLSSPTDEMKQAAADAALYKTFQRPLGPAMQKISTALNSAPVLKLFIPFVRTPTNLLKYAIERTPAAPLLKEVRQDFIAGGLKRDLAIAKMTLGTGIAALVAGLAEKGHFTGNGPADPSARKALEADGWQPYSFKVGDTYISYRRLDPWATIIGTAADAVELQSAMTEKQARDAGAIVTGAIVHNLASKTWLSGLSDLVDAITDPQANLKNTITRLGASMATPTLASQITQMIDPVIRDTTDPSYMGQLRKKIEARIPGLSTGVIARRDILGKELRNEGGPLARLLSPFDTRQVRSDPAAKAIYDSGARFSVPSRSVGGGRLSDKDFDNYQQVAAQLFYDAMKDTMADPEWLTMSRDEQRKEIEKIKTRSRKEARGELFGMEH